MSPRDRMSLGSNSTHVLSWVLGPNLVTRLQVTFGTQKDKKQ